MMNYSCSGIFEIDIGVIINRNFKQVEETPYFTCRCDSSSHKLCVRITSPKVSNLRRIRDPRDVCYLKYTSLFPGNSNDQEVAICIG